MAGVQASDWSGIKKALLIAFFLFAGCNHVVRSVAGAGLSEGPHQSFANFSGGAFSTTLFTANTIRLRIGEGVGNLPTYCPRSVERACYGVSDTVRLVFGLHT